VLHNDAVHKSDHAASAAGQGWCNNTEPERQKDYLKTILDTN